MRPTLRAVALLTGGIPVSLLAVIGDPGLWFVSIGYLGLCLVLIGLDAIRMLPPAALTVEVTPPPILYIGEADNLQLTLEIPGHRPALPLEIACDIEALLAAPDPRFTVAPPGEKVAVAVALQPLARGQAKVSRLWFRWTGPWRLMRRHWIVPVDLNIPVVPNVRAVQRAAISLDLMDSVFGSKAQLQQGEGSEFDSLREYTPGLDHRAIDWKHSARHRMLVCKEFRTERNHQIVLAFDTGHLMDERLGGISKLDHAINAGLKLAYVSLKAGDRIGVFGFDSQVRRFSEPVAGIQGFGRVQRESAELANRPEETNFTLGFADLLGRLNRRSLIVVLTDFVDTVTAELMVENLGRLARRHLVLFVTLRDPGLEAKADGEPASIDAMTQAVIAGDLLRERQVVFERLRRMGIQCLNTFQQQLDAALIDRYLAIKRQELI